MTTVEGQKAAAVPGCWRGGMRPTWAMRDRGGRRVEGRWALDMATTSGGSEYSSAMRKFKLWTTVDCVVGGLYWQRGSRAVDSLLLGLYDDDGQLNYVGRTPRLTDNCRSLLQATQQDRYRRY